MIVNTGEDDASVPGADADDLSLAFPPGAEPPFRTPVSVLVATAVRKGRRRRIATLSAKAALFALPVVAAAVVFANSSPGKVTTAVRPPSSPNGASSAPIDDCTGAQLSGKVFRGGSQSSQPFEEIVLTNGGPGPCHLFGYPRITAWGSTGQGPSAPLDTVLTQGSTFEIPDPGPTKLVLAPGGPAWFALGASTAYGGPMVSIDRVVIDVGSAAGGSAGHVSVTLGMGASGPQGKAIPITVTAFASGIPPTP
ncbi:MAG: DUF4232 domain-containing protein [Actinomycetota bacterium]